MNIKQSHLNSFKNTSNFDSNGGDDGVIIGGLDQWFFKPLSPKTPIPSSTHELERRTLFALILDNGLCFVVEEVCFLFCLVLALDSQHVVSKGGPSGHDALAAFTAEANPRKSTHNDSLSKKQGIDKGTKNCSFDYFITGTKKDASKAEKEANFDQDEFNTSPDLSSSDDATKQINLKDVLKLVQDVGIDLMDLDSLKDNQPFMVQDEEEEEVHA
nr:hypothetical protein [Tanacetum cinerariifolium]